MSTEVITVDEVMKNDAFEIFGILSLEPSLQHIVTQRGVLSNSTRDTVDRIYRRLSRLFHPDRNPDGADAFIKLKQCVDQLKDAEVCFEIAKEKLGVVRNETTRQDYRSRAQNEGVKLAKRMAAEQEMKRQQQIASEQNLKAGIQKVKEDLSGSGGGYSVPAGYASSATSSTNITSSTLLNNARRTAIEREQRGMMSEWERLELEMIEEWEVDSISLKRKEGDLIAAMKYLKQRSEIELSSSKNNDSEAATSGQNNEFLQNTLKMLNMQTMRRKRD